MSNNHLRNLQDNLDIQRLIAFVFSDFSAKSSDFLPLLIVVLVWKRKVIGLGKLKRIYADVFPQRQSDWPTKRLTIQRRWGYY